MNKEAVNGGIVFQIAAVDKLEETFMNLLRGYRMNAFAQQLHEQLLIRHGRHNRS